MTLRNRFGFGRHGIGCGCHAPALSRRQFGAAALGAGAALAAPAVMAPAVLAPAAQAQERPKLIDVHHHIVPPFWFEEVKERISAQGGGRIIPTWYGWSPQRALEELDR